MSSHYDTSWHIQKLLEPNFKDKSAKFNGEQEKESIICVRGDRKFVPLDHSLSSLGKPLDAKQ